jgi:hypothetical protein
MGSSNIEAILFQYFGTGVSPARLAHHCEKYWHVQRLHKLECLGRGTV